MPLYRTTGNFCKLVSIYLFFVLNQFLQYLSVLRLKFTIFNFCGFVVIVKFWQKLNCHKRFPVIRYYIFVYIMYHDCVRNFVYDLKICFCQIMVCRVIPVLYWSSLETLSINEFIAMKKISFPFNAGLD